jgi:hypothetical protein
VRSFGLEVAVTWTPTDAGDAAYIDFHHSDDGGVAYTRVAAN